MKRIAIIFACIAAISARPKPFCPTSCSGFMPRPTNCCPMPQQPPFTNPWGSMVQSGQPHMQPMQQPIGGMGGVSEFTSWQYPMPSGPSTYQQTGFNGIWPQQNSGPGYFMPTQQGFTNPMPEMQNFQGFQGFSGSYGNAGALPGGNFMQPTNQQPCSTGTC